MKPSSIKLEKCIVLKWLNMSFQYKFGLNIYPLNLDTFSGVNFSELESGKYSYRYINFVFTISRLDYCGIALLTMGSFVPWLYYSFYCRREPKIVYLVLIFVLGTACIVVSMWDRFAEPKFRAIRAG